MLLNSLDSLQREITRRILSDADKKELRACDREKSQFLKECRAADTAQVRVDRQIYGRQAERCRSQRSGRGRLAGAQVQLRKGLR